MSKKFEVVYIKWEDAISGSTEWQSLTEAMDWDDDILSQGHHVGIILAEEETHLLLVSDLMPHNKDAGLDDTKCFGVFRIPKSWVLERVTLGNINLAKGFKASVT